MTSSRFNALVAYEDDYVQPLILQALRSQLAPECYTLMDSLPGLTTALLQFCAYESLDFERALRDSDNLINAYIIRKALIRKHYLSHTVFSWTTKHPLSALCQHFKSAVDFELDYAEFLDDALVEAFELRASFEVNEGKEPCDREWWILKPGMSDRGQGIRLFSTEDELRAIFEEWEEDEEQSDRDDDEDDDDEVDTAVETPAEVNGEADKINERSSDYIVTSHLRHFIAQPYIHPPLLLLQSPFNNRKFHIRTYVVAAGALRIYVYNHMLALFASSPYRPPWDLATTNDNDEPSPPTAEALLQRMRDIHLTNTCVQTSRASATSTQAKSAETGSEAELPNVFLLSALPLSPNQHKAIKTQINDAMAELFRAAVALPTHFQPLPCAFEIFGVDFLVEDCATAAALTGGSGDDTRIDGNAEVNVQLLEVNAFPDFAQTGDELRDVVVKGLFEEVVRCVVAPFFGVNGERDGGDGSSDDRGRMTKVLDLDLGRR